MPGQPGEDSELINRAQSGDVEAFGDLYERYAPAIFRYLYAHMQSRLDAEDLTGDIFLKTWQSLPRYHERGVPFLAFLFRIARNALFDHYRRMGRPAADEPVELSGSLPDPQPGPADLLSSQADHQQVAYILGQLREDYRTVLVLRYINDLSPEETAQVMKRTPGNVRVLQHRALEALRKIMG